MAKESEKVTRIDVRIPNDIYEKIETIAIETKQPLHHRSGKPVITPIILNLINLGLEEVAKGEFDLEVLTDKVSANNRLDIKSIEDRVLEAVLDKLNGNNQVDIKQIEDRILETVLDKLNGNNQVDIKQIESRILEAVLDKLSVNNPIDVKQIEKKIITSLKTKIEVIVEDKVKESDLDKERIIEDKIRNIIEQVIGDKISALDLEEMIENKVKNVIEQVIGDKVSDVESDTNENFSQSIKEILSLEENEDNSGINEAEITEDIPADKEPILSVKSKVIENNHNSSQTNSDANQLSLIEDIADNSSLTYEDTVNEIKRLRKSLGANYAKIARRLTENNYPTKQGKYKWNGTQVKRILEP